MRAGAPQVRSRSPGARCHARALLRGAPGHPAAHGPSAALGHPPPQRVQREGAEHVARGGHRHGPHRRLAGVDDGGEQRLGGHGQHGARHHRDEEEAWQAPGGEGGGVRHGCARIHDTEGGRHQAPSSPAPRARPRACEPPGRRGAPEPVPVHGHHSPPIPSRARGSPGPVHARMWQPRTRGVWHGDPMRSIDTSDKRIASLMDAGKPQRQRHGEHRHRRASEGRPGPAFSLRC